MNAVLRPRLLLCIAIALAVTGCGLSSPYIKLPSEAERNKLCSEDACSIDNALSYSRQVRANYRAVLDRYARLRTGTGAALLGIGAAALGFSAVKAHRDVFTTLGFAGAATYSFEKFYENPDREEVFQQAIDALVCAEGAVGKLRLPASTRNQMNVLMGRLEHLPSEVTALRTLRPEVAGSLAVVTRRLETATGAAKQRAALDQELIDAVLKTLDRELERAGAAQADSAAALAAASRRFGVTDLAGYRLMQAVDAIQRATERAATKTIPDPASVFAMIGDLAGLAERFLPSADAVDALVAKAGTFRPQAAGDVRASPELAPKLREWAQRINAAAEMLDVFIRDTKWLLELAGSSSGDAFATLEQCRIAGLADIVLMPKDLAVAEKTATTFAIDVDGGKPPYSASLSGVQATAITFTPPRFNESRFVVTVTDKLVAGKYDIWIRDATQRKVKFELTAKAAQAATTTANPVATTSTPPSTPAPFDVFVNLATAKIKNQAFTIKAIEPKDDRVIVEVAPEPDGEQRDALPDELGKVKAGTDTLLDVATKQGKPTITLKN